MALVNYASSSEESDDDSAKKNTISLANPTKRKQPVKITIPSLPEDDNEDATRNKKPKASSISGLLSMLPAPKYSSTIGKPSMLVPDSVKRKAVQNNANKTVKSSSQCTEVNSMTIKDIRQTVEKPTSLLKDENAGLEEEVGDDKDGTLQSNFFSLDSSPQVKSSSMPVNLDYISEQPSQNPLPFAHMRTPLVFHDDKVPEYGSSYEETYLPSVDETHVPSVENSAASFCVSNETGYGSTSQASEEHTSTGNVEQDVTNDERFLRLQGKKARGFENIDIVDVSVDSQLAPRSEWHTKSLTEEKKVSFSRKKGEMPTQQQRRKHQITYLAFQAKERELDLKNQWAQNRLTKRETQSKYGF